MAKLGTEMTLEDINAEVQANGGSNPRNSARKAEYDGIVAHIVSLPPGQGISLAPDTATDPEENARKIALRLAQAGLRNKVTLVIRTAAGVVYAYQKPTGEAPATPRNRKGKATEEAAQAAG